MTPCRCGSGLIYPRCCQRFHSGQLPATPEELMRSRYTAYALGLADYIIDTTHPANPSYKTNRSQWMSDLQAYCDRATFHQLEVYETGVEGTKGVVRFHATITIEGRDVSFGEASAFEQIDGRWLYLDGILNSERC